MKVFSSCLITHKSKQVIRICRAHRFFALTLWHPFHLFRCFVWASSSPPPAACGLVEVGSGACSPPYKLAGCNPRWTVDLEGNDPETKKWMQPNLVLVALVTS